MIVADLQPLSIVQDGGFWELLHVLDPKYKIPSRQSISRSYLPDILYERKKKGTSRKTSSHRAVLAHLPPICGLPALQWLS